MKNLRIIMVGVCFSIVSVPIAGNDYEYHYAPFSNTPPSEYAKRQLETISSYSWDDGPDGSGFGNGGAVGAPVVALSIWQAVAFVGAYYFLRKKSILSNTPDNKHFP
ncbi:MAG: hypothetical protein LBR34_10570 [Prevotella sp.]|jgi:hypothetical protein|nr:hypothetical protein [Prevotella sp.]